MIYLKNISRTQRMMIPRSEGTTIILATEDGGDYKTTYTSAELDARFNAIQNAKLDKECICTEKWDFTLDDGSVVEKMVTLWNADTSQI